MPHGKSYFNRVVPDPLTHGMWVIHSRDILLSKASSLQATPRNIRESEGLCSSAGEKAGWPPGHSEARRPALARRVRERFGERKGTHRNAWFPSSLQASDLDNDLRMQFWSWGLSIDDFFAPLVIERDQQTSAELAEATL